MPRLLELIAAPYTPFRPDGTLNLDQIGPYAQSLVGQGINGVFICGTTGEGVSLTTAERKDLAAEWKKVAPPRFTIIVHVGHNSLEDAADLARHAAQIGLDAVAAMPPTFFVPAGEDILIDCCAKIAAAAPALPFYYYHIPSMTRVNFPVAGWMERAAERIPNFGGVKYTHEDIADFAKCRTLAGGKFKCYFGRDELLLDTLQRGATAAVGSTYNYAGRLYRAIDTAFQAGHIDDARRLQKLACDFIEVLQPYGFFGAAKSLMEHIGIDCGNPRLPLAPFPHERKADLLADLEALGVFQYVHA